MKTENSKTHFSAILTIVMIISLFCVVSTVSATNFVTVDLGDTYTFRGTDVQYIKSIDVTDTGQTKMWMASPEGHPEIYKTINTPKIGALTKEFSSTTGESHGVTVTILDASTTVNYNSVLNEHLYTSWTYLPTIKTDIPGKSGVIILSRFNDSAIKGDINSKADLILLQDAAYIYVNNTPGHRAILYDIVGDDASQGIKKEGAINPPYDENNLGWTVTQPVNIIQFDPYTSLGGTNPRVAGGKYAAVATEYKPAEKTFYVYGAMPSIVLNGDRTITWNGAAPSTYIKNSGDVLLSFNNNNAITNISYLVMKSNPTYDVKVYVDTNKFADYAGNRWDALGDTKPVPSAVLVDILNGVGTENDDPYTYAIKETNQVNYPPNATSWSSVAITNGYGTSGYARSNSVTIPGLDLSLLYTGSYYIYALGLDENMNIVALDQQTVTIQNPGGGGGGGGGGGLPPTPVTEFKTTGTVTTNSDGIVQESIKVLTADEKAYFSIPEGIKALDAEGLPLKEVIIQATDDISAPASGFTFAGHAIDAFPAGATFDPAITLTFQLTEEEWANLPAGETFTVKWFNAGTGAWENVPTYVDPTTHRVVAEVTHFSTFAVFMQEAGVVEPTPPTTPVTTTPVGTETTPVAPEPPGEFPWTIVIGIIVILAIISAGYWYYTNQD